MGERLSDVVYSAIKEDIISGRLKSNSFFTESEMAAQHGVSKAPVKTALQALTQEGFLLCFPRKGYMVPGVTFDEYESVRELRIHLEQLSVKLAIERASDDEIRSLCDAYEEKPGEGPQFKTNNTRFHLRLAGLARNPYLSETLQKLLLLTARYAIGRQADNTYHDQIIEALLARDEARALEQLTLDLNADKL